MPHYKYSLTGKTAAPVEEQAPAIESQDAYEEETQYDKEEYMSEEEEESSSFTLVDGVALNKLKRFSVNFVT